MSLYHNYACSLYSPNGFSNILQLTMMLHRNMSYKLKTVVIFLKITICFLLSQPFESSFEKIRLTQIKSSVNRIAKIYIEKKKKLIERKRKLSSASTGCKRHIPMWHQRTWCVGYARTDTKWRDGFQTLKNSFSPWEGCVRLLCGVCLAFVGYRLKLIARSQGAVNLSR